MTQVRRATADDVPQIAATIQDVWEQSIDESYCRQLIAQGVQVVRVAVVDHEIAGFVAGFLTTGQAEVRRWEVDLLAVKTAHQGKRLGQKLVEAAWEDAVLQGVKFARALIKVDNIASQHSFERAGYAANGQIYEMVLWPPLESDNPLRTKTKGLILSPVAAIPVDTLTYRGLWLEGLDSPSISNEDRRAAITGGRALVAREARLNTGALIPVDAPLPDELRNGAEINGRYQWWQKPR